MKHRWNYHWIKLRMKIVLSYNYSLWLRFCKRTLFLKICPNCVCTIADLIKPSPPRTRSSMLTMLHIVLGTSSWICRMSPIIILCRLFPLSLWNSLRDVKYCFFYLVSKCCRNSCCCLLRFSAYAPGSIFLVSLSSLWSFKGHGSVFNLQSYKIWDGVSGSESFSSVEMYVNRRSFSVHWISVATMCSIS